jgi:uncharacterized membrane protein
MLARFDRIAVRLPVCLALAALGVAFALTFRLPSHLMLVTGDNSQAVGPVTSRTAFVQELDITGPARIASLEVLLATWGKPTNTTHDEIRVFDGSGRRVDALQLPPGTVKDNDYLQVVLPRQLSIDGHGKFFVVLSSSDGSPAHSITAWATPGSEAGRLYSVPAAGLGQGSLLAVIGAARLLKGALWVHVSGQGPHRLLAEKALRVGGLLVFVVLAVCAWWARTARRWGRSAVRRLVDIWTVLGERLDRIRIEHVYVVVAVVWGLTMVLIVPPFQAPDEVAHYYRAWSVADLELAAHAGPTVRVPQNVASLPVRLGSAVVDWKGSHYSTTKARSLLWEPISHKGTDAASAAAYGPIGYVPQAVGIDIARLLGHSPLLGFYFGRLLNLLTSVIIVFLALRLLPFGKPLMALVGLFPMFIAQIASISPDGLALSGALLFTALVLSRIQQESVSYRDVVLLGVVGAVLLNAKPGYAVLALLVVGLVPRQLGGWAHYVKCVGGIVAATAAVAVALLAVTPQASSGSLAALGVTGINENAQLSFIAHHPHAFLKVLHATFEVYAVPWGQEIYGVLGWLTVFLPYVGMLVMGLAIVLFLGRAESITMTLWQRLVMVGTAGVLAVTVCIALYAGNNPVAFPVVAGVQGRYFIPVVVLGLFSIYGIELRQRRTAILVLIVVLAVVATTTVHAVLKFYY